jgi:hypothetical protein
LLVVKLVFIVMVERSQGRGSGLEESHGDIYT